VIEVRRVDFIAQPVEDLRAAEAWYGDTLGLPRNPHSSGDRWAEYETGNLTLALSTFGGALALGVDDVAESRGRLEAAGVEFAGETFDSGVCHGANFTDPFGNRLQLHHRYAPLEHFEAPAAVERTDFVNVPVTDRARGVAFFTETLGLERNPLASDEWPELGADNVGFVLSTPEQKGGGEFKPEVSIAFRVPDVAASMERLRGAGVEVQPDEPSDSGVCHMAFFRDPDGNSLMLHHRYAPYSDGSKP
jgi:catechol 2,3-dioxygenase-like lactoylglutathione lyase family enzyme